MPSDWETSDMCNHMKGILEKVAELEKVLGYSDTKSKLLDSFSDLYKYLDSISLLQETALFNILLLLLILLSLFNIFSALFGNEVIKYFKLEERLPKLASLFRLRTNLQKYSILWSALTLFVGCIFGVIVNLILLTVT